MKPSCSCPARPATNSAAAARRRAPRRRIRFTPEIPGHRIGETRPEWEIPVLIGRKSMSNGDKLFPFDDTQAIREEMARVMPIYQGIEKLTKEGDQLQWGGPYLFKDGFTAMAEKPRAVYGPRSTGSPTGRGQTLTRHAPRQTIQGHDLRISTDQLTGTERRDSILPLQPESRDRNKFSGT